MNHGRIRVAYIKSGEVSMVDASVIKAKPCRPNKGNKDDSTKTRKLPGTRRRDWIGNGKVPMIIKPTSMLMRTGLSRPRMTVQEVCMIRTDFVNLLSGKEAAVYADSVSEVKPAKRGYLNGVQGVR